MTVTHAVKQCDIVEVQFYIMCLRVQNLQSCLLTEECHGDVTARFELTIVILKILLEYMFMPMVRAHSMCGGRGEVHTGFLWGNLREGDHLED
jgi:hypothetical protein